MLVAARRRMSKVAGTPNRGRMSMMLRCRGALSGGAGRSRPANLSTSNMKVVVRVRPRTSKDAEGRDIVKVIDEKLLIFDPKESEDPFYVGGMKQKNRNMLKRKNREVQFIFDRVFGFNASNQDVFEGSTKELIKNLLDGFNCSVFVYGATGAGKTFTMLGNKANPGISYLTMVELYNAMEGMKDEKDFDLNISYLEVYNETVHDLISPSGPLKIHDDGTKGTVVSGIQVHRITNAEELFSMLEKGNNNRTQHPTDANAESSRSHAVFQVMIRISDKLSNQVKVSKLLMIDLAGSERGSATGGKGKRFCEGSNINKSLLALGNCVNALADGQKHIPYRDSKLTRLLKDSLGGNCKTVMIANVSPNIKTFEETFNTLNYATRARKINTKVHTNVYSVDMHVNQYIKLVEELRRKVSFLEEQLEEEKSKRTTLVGCNVEQLPVPSSADAVLHHEAVSEWKVQLDTCFEKMFDVQAEGFRCDMDVRVLEHKLRVKKETLKRMKRMHLADQILGIKSVEASIARLEHQLQAQETNRKAAQSSLVECECHAMAVKNQLEENGLIENLQETIGKHLDKLEKQSLMMRLQAAEKLNSLQRFEALNLEKMMREMTSAVDYYYTSLKGSSNLTVDMKEKYKEMVNLVSGMKEVSWKETPGKERRGHYSLLKKVINISWDECGSQNHEAMTPLRSAIPTLTHVTNISLPPEQRGKLKFSKGTSEEASADTLLTSTPAGPIDKNCSQENIQITSNVLSPAVPAVMPVVEQRLNSSKETRRETFVIPLVPKVRGSVDPEQCQQFNSSEAAVGSKFAVPIARPDVMELLPEKKCLNQIRRETFLLPPVPVYKGSPSPDCSVKLNSSEEKFSDPKQSPEQNNYQETSVIPTTTVLKESATLEIYDKLNSLDEALGRKFKIPLEPFAKFSCSGPARRETFVIPCLPAGGTLVEPNELKETVQKTSMIDSVLSGDAESSQPALQPDLTIQNACEIDTGPCPLANKIEPSSASCQQKIHKMSLSTNPVIQFSQHELATSPTKKIYFTPPSMLGAGLMTPEQRRTIVSERLSCHKPFFAPRSSSDTEVLPQELNSPLIYAQKACLVSNSVDCTFRRQETIASNVSSCDDRDTCKLVECDSSGIKQECMDENIQNTSDSKASPGNNSDIENSLGSAEIKRHCYNLRSSCCGCPSHTDMSSDSFKKTRVSQSRDSREKKTSPGCLPQHTEEEFVDDDKNGSLNGTFTAHSSAVLHGPEPGCDAKTSSDDAPTLHTSDPDSTFVKLDPSNVPSPAQTRPISVAEMSPSFNQTYTNLPSSEYSGTDGSNSHTPSNAVNHEDSKQDLNKTFITPNPGNLFGDQSPELDSIFVPSVSLPSSVPPYTDAGDNTFKGPLQEHLCSEKSEHLINTTVSLDTLPKLSLQETKMDLNNTFVLPAYEETSKQSIPPGLKSHTRVLSDQNKMTSGILPLKGSHYPPKGIHKPAQRIQNANKENKPFPKRRVLVDQGRTVTPKFSNRARMVSVSSVNKAGTIKPRNEGEDKHVGMHPNARIPHQYGQPKRPLHGQKKQPVIESGCS